ncbi:NapC/NirT family cytochrome c [Magnetococcus sp. PR-3]|uniref:NapC/NirT family cytochrome c n=1 Tax=Magnetococcus sp. PR-3 TaxID=3120355 RepID=UPI002FCE08BF
MIKRMFKWIFSHGEGPRWILLATGLFAGIIFWGGFNTFMEFTNTYEFCTSCHEMSVVQAEYEKSPHAHNASGVPAICSDCHVPRPWVAKLKRKIQASNELWHWALGSIDTPEEFEEHRINLAQNVWRSMEKTDSRECRNCHTPDKMKVAKQSPLAQKLHKKLLAGEQTCINCHKGIAHNLPQMERIYNEMENKLVSAGKVAKLAGSAVVLKSAMLYSETKESAMKLADVLAGSELVVERQQGEWVEVTFKAWDRDEGPKMFIDFNQPVELGKLSFDGMDMIKAGEIKVDEDYGSEWRQVAIKGWIKRDLLGADSQAYWTHVQKLYKLDCNLCHIAYTRDLFIQQDWANNLKEMRRYTKLSPEQLTQVSGWVLRGARANTED